jgi:DNA mismatch repair protein MSH6
MKVDVDRARRKVTFLYKLEDGVAEGSFGMHCAAMCGIPDKVVARAEVAAREWEHTSRLKEKLEVERKGTYLPLGLQSDVAWMLRDGPNGVDGIAERALEVLMREVALL